MSKKTKCPYSFPHKTRKDRVDYICGIGGYGSRYDKWPIEFTVAAYYTDFDFDHIWEKYAAEHWPFDESKETPETIKAYYDLARRLHKEHEGSLWSWGQEDAYRPLSDGDAYRTLWDGTMLDVKLELHGRCGKHLVIAEFEGRSLRGVSTEDLSDEMMRQTRPDGYSHVEYDILKKGNFWDGWTNKEVETFYKYVRQCEIDFTSDKASAEVEYQGAFNFFCNIVNPEWETVKQERATHDEAVEAARAVREVMQQSSASGEEMTYFATLCTAAGIDQSELG